MFKLWTLKNFAILKKLDFLKTGYSQILYENYALRTRVVFKNPAKHLRGSLFAKILGIDVWLGSKYASDVATNII